MKRFTYPALVLVLIAGGGLLSFLCAETLTRIYRQVFPPVAVLKTHYPVAVRKDQNRIIYSFRKERPAHWLSIKQIPRKVIAAILLSEDASFFQHRGYSAEAIRAAWEYNQKPGVKIKRGGSTITQQVVKNLFLTPEKTISRKIRELLLAVELERQFSKSKILETYLNIAEWGPGIYGIAQASRLYFDKEAADLSPREAAVLAFMLPNPNKYRYSIRDGELTDFAKGRVEAILERMWKTGQISEEEHASAGIDHSDELPSDL